MMQKTQHDRTQMHPDATSVTIYIDGSGIENKIGAAAYNSSTDEARHQHLGNEAQFNVFYI